MIWFLYNKMEVRLLSMYIVEAFVPEAPCQSSIAAALVGCGQPVGAESRHLDGGGRCLADAAIARGGILGLVDGVAGVGTDGPVVSHLPSEEVAIRL